MDKRETKEINRDLILNFLGFLKGLLAVMFKIAAVFFAIFSVIGLLIYLWFRQYTPVFEFDHDLGEVRLFNSHFIIPETPDSFLNDIGMDEAFNFQNDVSSIESINIIADKSRLYIRGMSSKFKYQCRTRGQGEDDVKINKKRDLIASLPPDSNCMIFVPPRIDLKIAGSDSRIILETISNNISVDLSKGFLNWRNQKFDQFTIDIKKDKISEVVKEKSTLKRSTYLFRGDFKIDSSTISLKNL